MNVVMEGNTPTVIGTIDKTNFIPANDKFFKDCSVIINLINKNKEWYYNINGKPMSLYQIMELYEANEPSDVQRYKGLGEMDDDIKDSTLYPGSNRTLIRYTMDDVKEVTKVIREYETDTKKILNHVGLINRADLLD